MLLHPACERQSRSTNSDLKETYDLPDGSDMDDLIYSILEHRDMAKDADKGMADSGGNIMAEITAARGLLFFVINLPSREDRRRHMEELLYNIGIPRELVQFPPVRPFQKIDLAAEVRRGNIKVGVW